jgi:hypothetical protein
MYYHAAKYAALAAYLVNIARAGDRVTVPDTIPAGTSFQLNATDLDSSDKYRVYLAAALGGETGPTCTSNTLTM